MTQTLPPPTAPATAAVAVVRAPVEIDLTNISAFRNALRSCMEAGHPTVHVDMSDVRFMDCTAVNTVVAARREAACRGRWVTVVRPSRVAARVLTLARATALLDDKPAFSEPVGC